MISLFLGRLVWGAAGGLLSTYEMYEIGLLGLINNNN